MKLIRQLILSAAICFTACKKESVFKTYDRPQVTISSNDSRFTNTSIHLSKDTVYVLSSDINRYSGQSLIIDAGTVIKVNDGLSININPGARIEALGTAEEPIVFTSSAYAGGAGFIDYSNNTTEHSWLGISIHGTTPNSTDAASLGSGILKYVRIEFAGSSLNNFQDLPPLLLENVGIGTVIENIQVSYSVSHNSFEISGGNFNARNLISYASGGSDFNLRDGYTGMLQNLLAYRHPYFSPRLGSGLTLAGLQISGGTTFPAISNLTVIGPGLQSGANPKYSDTIRPGVFGNVDGSRVAGFVVTGGQFHIRNTVIMGFPKGGFYLDETNSAASLHHNNSDFMHSIVQCEDSARTFYLTPNVYKPFISLDFKEFMLKSEYGNQIYSSSSQFMLTDIYNYNTAPDPLPQANSPLLNGANFDGPVFNDSFFEKVSYRGALGAENWLRGWANFVPLQTNYNN